MSFWEDDLAAEPNGASPAQQAVAAVKRGSTWRRPLPIARVPVRDAVPVLGRARHEPNVHPAAAYWGRVAHFALKLIARGRLLPGVTTGGLDAWRVGPFDPADFERLKELVAAMPESARTPPTGRDGPKPPSPLTLVRGFLDAVADGMPRSPGAARTAGGLAL